MYDGLGDREVKAGTLEHGNVFTSTNENRVKQFEEGPDEQEGPGRSKGKQGEDRWQEALSQRWEFLWL